MLNKKACILIGYDRLVQRLADEISIEELENLETKYLKKKLGAGYEKWEFKDWYRLIKDIKRSKQIKQHESLTAEVIFNSIPYAAQCMAQAAVKCAMVKAQNNKLYQMDETADTIVNVLWNMFYCMAIDIKCVATKLCREQRTYSYEDTVNNKLLLDFIKMLRDEQWYKHGDVARLRTKETN